MAEDGDNLWAIVLMAIINKHFFSIQCGKFLVHWDIHNFSNFILIYGVIFCIIIKITLGGTARIDICLTLLYKYYLHPQFRIQKAGSKLNSRTGNLEVSRRCWWC